MALGYGPLRSFALQCKACNARGGRVVSEGEGAGRVRAAGAETTAKYTRKNSAVIFNS